MSPRPHTWFCCLSAAPCGRLIAAAPEGAHSLTGRARECVASCGEQDSADAIKFQIFFF